MPEALREVEWRRIRRLNMRSVKEELAQLVYLPDEQRICEISVRA
jgi:hypothetical protein